MSTSPQAQMETATEFLAASLGMSREQLIGQIVSQCLDELPNQESQHTARHYVLLDPVGPPTFDSATTVILPDKAPEDLEVRHLEGSKG